MKNMPRHKKKKSNKRKNPVGYKKSGYGVRPR